MAAVSRSFHERPGVAGKKEGRDVIHALAEVSSLQRMMHGKDYRPLA
jgi:hypothetical protein